MPFYLVSDVEVDAPFTLPACTMVMRQDRRGRRKLQIDALDKSEVLRVPVSKPRIPMKAVDPKLLVKNRPAR